MPKHRGVKKLRDLKVEEISAVIEGANEDAQILIHKMKGKGFEACADCPNSEACSKAGKCAIETPAKDMKGGDKKTVRKGLDAAEAASEVLVTKSGGAVSDDGLPFIAVARAAVDEGVEKAAATFEEIYGAQAQIEKLRMGVGALNQAIWQALDDREDRANAASSIAKSVMQFGSWLEDEFDVSAIAKAGDDEEDEETAAGGSGEEDPEGSGVEKSGDNDMDVRKQLDDAIAKAKATAEENLILKSRLEKLEETEAERAIEKAAATLSAAAPKLALPADKLRVVAKQLDVDGHAALVDVLKAADKQVSTGSLFGTIGTSDPGGKATDNAGGDRLIAKAHERRKELEKAAGRA